MWLTQFQISEVEEKLKTFAPFTVHDSNTALRRIDFANFSAWVATGDQFNTEAMKVSEEVAAVSRGHMTEQQKEVSISTLIPEN